MNEGIKTLIKVIIAVLLISVLAAIAIISLITPVSRVQTFQEQSGALNSVELTKSIVDQVFPASKYTIEDGMIYFSSQIEANYQTLYLEQIRYGNFIDNKDEYLAVLRAPEEVTVHAGGFYYAVVAVFDGKTNKIKSPVKQIMTDEGEISILNSEAQDYMLFLGSTTYQGWTIADGAVYDISQGYWEKIWPIEQDFFKDRYAVYGNNRLVLYKRVIDPHNYESAIPPNHFELDTELIWDQSARTFREPEIWE